MSALNTFVTFPMFVLNGRKWALESIMANDTDTNESEKEEKEKTEEDKKISLEIEANRPAFRQLWDLFMVCYEGYFGFTASTLVCIYKYPKETMPIFSYSLFALYVYKLYALKKSVGLGTGVGGGKDSAQYKAKVNSIIFFFLPCYGGYCVLHSLDYLKDMKSIL